MSWSSGTELLRRIIPAIKANVKDEKARLEIYIVLIESFMDADWDCTSEVRGLDPIMDIVLGEDPEGL